MSPPVPPPVMFTAPDPVKAIAPVGAVTLTAPPLPPASTVRVDPSNTSISVDALTVMSPPVVVMFRFETVPSPTVRLVAEVTDIGTRGALALADDGSLIGVTRTLADGSGEAVLFDGHDEGAVAKARDQWRMVADAGLKAVYWAQDERGAWVKRSETG